MAVYLLTRLRLNASRLSRLPFLTTTNISTTHRMESNDATPPPSAPQDRPPMRQWRTDLRGPRTPIAENIHGTVKWFDVGKGFGFITRADTNEDVFVHFTNIVTKNPQHIMRTLGDGESVVFNVVEGPTGREAVQVTGPNGESVRGSERSMSAFYHLRERNYSGPGAAWRDSQQSRPDRRTDWNRRIQWGRPRQNPNNSGNYGQNEGFS